MHNFLLSREASSSFPSFPDSFCVLMTFMLIYLFYISPKFNKCWVLKHQRNMCLNSLWKHIWACLKHQWQNFNSHQFAWARKHLNEKLIRKHPGVLNHATLIWMWLTDRKKNYSFIEREGNGTCVSEGKISAT